MNTRGWEEGLRRKPGAETERETEEEQFVTEMFPTYRSMGMGGTNDYLAVAAALHAAFQDSPKIQSTEERVKVILFVTDGCGYVDFMTRISNYLHDVPGSEFPQDLASYFNYIEPGSSERTIQRIKQYKDQIFFVGVGIANPQYAKTFLDVFNGGKRPDESDYDAFAENNVALVDPSRVAELPGKLIRVLRSKFASPKFRNLRGRFHDKRAAKRIRNH